MKFKYLTNVIKHITPSILIYKTHLISFCSISFRMMYIYIFIYVMSIYIYTIITYICFNI